jgi:putative aldouronate transport system substrate-binding protein
VIYLVPPTKKTTDALDGRVLYYRKDWAKSVGITVGETVTDDQIAELAKAFMEKDPGGNGAGKTVGFTAVPANVNHTFVQVYNTFFDQFHKVDGKYVWGGFEPSTLEGIKNLKKYYDMGFIDKDYFTFKSKEHYDKFDSGLAGMFVDGAGAQNVNERFVAFARSNPNIKASDAIGLATVVGPDNKFHGQSYMNYWAGLIFNPKIEDKKLDRILNILDYICTEQGQRLIFAGIEGRDYTMNGDQITITREKDKDGNFKYIGDLYPSYNFFFTKAVLPDDWSSRDPSLPAEARDTAVNMFLVKEQNMDLTPLDYDALLFAGEKKLKFSVNLSDVITNMILSDKDIDSQWNEFVAQNQDAVNGVVEEMNAALVK